MHSQMLLQIVTRLIPGFEAPVLAYSTEIDLRLVEFSNNEPKAARMEIRFPDAAGSTI